MLELIRFRERLRGVALAVSGEGTLDETTTEGKAPWRARLACQQAGVRCALFGGRVELDAPDIHALSGDPRRAVDDLRVLARKLTA